MKTSTVCHLVGKGNTSREPFYYWDSQNYCFLYWKCYPTYYHQSQLKFEVGELLPQFLFELLNWKFIQIFWWFYAGQTCTKPSHMYWLSRRLSSQTFLCVLGGGGLALARSLHVLDRGDICSARKALTASTPSPLQSAHNCCGTRANCQDEP